LFAFAVSAMLYSISLAFAQFIVSIRYQLYLPIQKLRIAISAELLSRGTARLSKISS